MENQSITKKCPSCQEKISLNATKCPYCGKDFRSWFRRHPILTAIIGFFIFTNIIGGFSSVFYKPKTFIPKDSIVKENIQITPVWDTKVVKGKTILELEQALGKPSSDIKPEEEMYGEIIWEKGGISFSTAYLSRNEIPQAFEFQFSDVKLDFSSDDFNKGLQLVCLDLIKNQFKNTSPSGFTRYTAKNLAGFERIYVQSEIGKWDTIKLIWFVQACRPDELLCK